MIEKVVNRANLLKAYHQVVSNQGSAGIDGMGVKGLLHHLKINRDSLVQSIREGNYFPQSILGVAIPKSKGKTRLLGIPTVTDRLFQQAVNQVIMPLFEVEFTSHSYGFRPNRNAQQAVQQAHGNINAGYQHIVDIDLKNFFDEVDHCVLLQLLYSKVTCAKTLRLIRKWLRSPILIKGKLIQRRKGVPQGSPLSPLLSNILLHELDKELEKQGLRYVRYADDFSIYTKSKTTARKVGNSIYLFLHHKLKLTINKEKSGIRKPVQFEILGYKFVPTYIKGDKGKYQLVVSEKGWERLKQNVKSITRKTSQHTFEQRIHKLKEVQRGWLNYFRMASITGKLGTLDSWVRNRLRYCIWKNWKKPERKRKNLIRLGIDPNHAYSWSRTRMGGWAVAQSPMLLTSITLMRLKQKGYESMLEHYLKVAPQLNEPLYARTARTVV
jgi:group II intron reverse transcriptase/maturase